MLTILIFLPLAVSVALAALPRLPDRVVRWTFVAATGVEVMLAGVLWAGFTGPGYGYQVRVPWIPSIGVSYHVGVDGISLPLVAMTAVLFLACAVYSLRQTRRVRGFVALLLFLETTSLGLFAALDLILFFLFLDLSIVGMYFVIAGWGHRDNRRSALTFFLYTFLGSLVLLLGFIGLYLAASPSTFDIVRLAEQRPLAGSPVEGGLVLLAVCLGLAVKTPLVPLHSWLPPAHTDAPAAGSAILAGVLLKMGAYGFVRIAMPVLPEAWRQYAMVFVLLGVTGALYGALVALAQRDLKRMIAYTSVNHMGYLALGVGTAGILAGNTDQARQLAVAGSVTQMVSHGLITGALFLLAGVCYDRAGSYEMDRYGGLAGTAPRFAALVALGAFAALGLPGFSGFIAEFQIFTGSLGAAPVPTALALLGILVTAALFLRALQRVFLGPQRLPLPGVPFPDARPSEVAATVPLLGLALVIGVLPRFLLELVEPGARAVAELVAR
ncbi:complex I subunit 4 family protein [Amycolatopsis aidingensis]|uniref:complex I subunit 4 family protein n=1 Tax=Amycolatopsis aidingensis TaxID=2842453 RepID=UPI001C0E38AF|nr:NADH-quinone oxidoreductase subunit M [Amycolatopsis aidingensis]